MTRRSKLIAISLLFSGLAPGPFVFGQNPALPANPVVRAVVELVAIGPGKKDTNHECGGTGFLVNEEGYILTNAHVVDEARLCLEQSPGARIMARRAAADNSPSNAVSCDLVGLDENHDLALLKIERPFTAGSADEKPPFLALDISEAKEGDPVSVTGFPLFAWQPVTQSGKVILLGRLRLSGTAAGATDAIVVNIPLQPGNSGSPVYQGSGVIAVVESQERLLPLETVAIPARYAVELLDRYGVKWHAAEGSVGP